MNYQIDDEQPGTSAGTDKVFSDRTVRELKRVEPRHQCLVCGYVARSKYNFVIHSRSHTGETPFSCDLCNQKFGRKGTLQCIYWLIRTSDDFSVLNVITRLLQNSTLQYIFYNI